MRTPSKINLLLNVFSERADGYHELDTVFFPLQTPSDTVTMSFGEAKGIRIRCTHPGVPLDPEKNLCGKAVRAYCGAASLPVPGCTIDLQKEIPCAGGMGGGSSDAAAVLLLMQEQFHALNSDVLADAALHVGADVPFFLNPVPSRAGGVGEKLEALAGVPHTLPLAIATPDFPVSAKWAYDHWTPAEALDPGLTERLIAALTAGDWDAAAPCLKNSLAPAIFRKFPLLVQLQDAFLQTGALCAQITGSGPAVFALFPSFEMAKQSAATLSESFAPIHFFAEEPEK